MTELVFEGGLYWRGIRITESVASVDVLPGLYIMPFSTRPIHVLAHVQVQRINMAGNARFLCWSKYARWLWLPRLFPASACV